MDSEDVVTKLSDVLTSVAVKVGKTLQDSEAIIDLRSGYSDRPFVCCSRDSGNTRREPKQKKKN